MRASIILLLLVLVRFRRGKLRNRAYLTRDSLLAPADSAWRYLFVAKNDGAFRNTMSLDVNAFMYLHSCVSVSLTLKRAAGRKVSLDSYGILGLTLHYLNSTMVHKSLCQIFGITPAVCCRLLNLGLSTLEKAVETIPECSIDWPSQSRMDFSANLIHAKVPGLKEFKVFGFVDGLNLQIQNPSDPLEQNAYYNGWKCSTFCSQVLVYDPEGLIIWVRYNCPGSWHDITVAQPLLEHMLKVPDPYCILGDSGFQSGAELKKKILVPLKATSAVGADAERRRRMELLSMSVVKGRQAAEWGMRSLQGSFGRLKSILTKDTDKRQRILKISFHLHNFIVRCVGINQTGHVFDQKWSEGEMGGKDRVAEFYHLQG